MAVKKLHLHAIVVKKEVGLAAAKKVARQIMKRKPGLVRPTEESLRFQNIAKGKFIPDSFRSKKVNEDVTLIFGHLKEDAAGSDDE
jgi:trimethylamine:corrinoid methyltransferase-like protein